MNPISRTLASLGTSPVFDAVVVGSGYGGSVAALRLAEAGREVCLLERGAEVLPGSYPTTLSQAAGQLRLVTAEAGVIPPAGEGATPPNGMMEVRLGPDMHVILGNGLGGGSLINANVAARPDPRVLASASWPQVYHDPAAMDAYFSRASAMLGATPLPKAINPPKLAALQVSADAVGQLLVRPPLAVNFTEGQVSTGGIAQPACTHCGDCCAGCNYGAKNTLLMNYLPLAAQKGAVIVTGAQVVTITPVAGTTDFAVTVQDMTQPATAPAITIKAGAVVLAAGALGSTEILARSSAAGLSLPKQSLGQRFSGNGDILGFGLDANVTQVVPASGPNPPPVADPPELYSIGAGANPATGVPGQGNPFAPGPTITGMVQVRMGPGDPLSKALVIEDGVAPGALALVYPAIFMLDSALSANMLEYPDAQRRLQDIQALGSQIMGGSLSASLSYQAPMTRMQSYLIMSHDRADGKLTYSTKTGMVFVDWPDVGQSRPYPADNAWLDAMAKAIWANYLPNPLWQKQMGGQLVSVHPLGGAVMAETAAKGMVDPDCRLFTGNGDAVYPNFLVCDGSVLPSSLGINPFLTITAVAERAMERYLGSSAQPLAVATPVPMQTPTFTPTPAPVSAPRPAPAPTPTLDPALLEIVAVLDVLLKVVSLGKTYDPAKDKGPLLLELYAAAAAFLPPQDQQKAAQAIDQAVLTLQPQDLRNACSQLDQDIHTLLDAIETPGTDETRWAALEAAAFALLGPVDPTLAFTESMRGYAAPTTPVQAQVLSSGYALSAAVGKTKGMSVIANFSVVDDNSQNLKTMPDGFGEGLVAELSGTITIDKGARQPIENGSFTLFKPDGDTVETWMMVYKGTLGTDYSFTGTKYLARPDQTGLGWFGDLTTLYVDFTPLLPSGKALQGILTLGIQDMAPQVAGTTARYSATDATPVFLHLMQKLGAGQLDQAVTSRAVLNRLALAVVGVASQSGSAKLRNLAAQLATRYEAAVAEFFGKLVFRTNGGLLSYLYDFPARDAVTPPSGVPQEATGWQIATTKGGTAQAWKAQRFLLDSSGAPSQDPDLAAIVLYRYKGVPDGKMKGPVVLSPGYGTTVLSFACLTNSTQGATDNLVIQLLQAGYDVWLYDNRSRPRAAKVDVPHFTLDDIAQTDWPAAVNFILQTTGANTVQVMGHCVGAMSAQMALLAGGLEGKVRSMVSSQLTVQPVTNWFNQAKADIDLASILAQSKLAPILQRLSNAGLPVPQALIDALTDTNDIDAITPPGASSDSDQLLNLMAWYAPFGGDHPCDSPTCHRIFAIFGPSYLHDNLNEATHNAIRDFFGKVTMSSFVQLGQIVAAGHAVDASGGDAYMPNVARLNLPIHFIAGAKNLEFLPDTSLKTLRWLQTSLPKGAGPFSRKLYHSYGHMDFFIGRNAGQDIFPDIVAELDKYN